jgi:molecular chaperone GrpE
MQKTTKDEERPEKKESNTDAEVDKKDSIGRKFSKKFSASNIKSKINAHINSDDTVSQSSPSKQTKKEAELTEELNKTQQDLVRLRNQLVRLASDYELMRKNKAKEVLESKDFAISQFAKDLMEPFENLFRIKENIKVESEDDDPICSSLNMTLREFVKASEKNGLIRIFPLGKKFNHDFHEVVSMVQTSDKDPGIVIEVLQAGYMLNNRLIKPATVVITTRDE